MKKLMALILTTLLLLTMGSALAEPVELSFVMWDEAQKPTIQENVDAFNEMHQDSIHVTIELVPWSDYWIKLDASLGTSQAADVMWMNAYVTKYQPYDLLLPLNEFIDAESFDLTQYPEGNLNAFKIGENYYCLPKGMDTVFVALNTEIFDRYGVEVPTAPWTWDDMREIASQLRDAISETGGSEYPIVMELDAQPSWQNFMTQNGGYRISTDARTVGVGLPESIDAVQQMVDLMANGQMASYEVLSETKGTDLFISGKAAIVFIGSWKASVLENSSLGQEGYISLIEMPSMNDNNTCVLGGLGYAISATTEHPAEAWEFVKYITGFEAMKHEAENGIDIPCQVEAQAYYSSGFQYLKNANVITDVSATGWPSPNNGNFEYATPINDAVALALSGMAPVEETLLAAQEEAQAILDEYFAEME